MGLSCFADGADEATLAGLKALPDLRRLSLRFGRAVAIDQTGYDRLAALPLEAIRFSCHHGAGTLDAQVVRRFAAMPTLTSFGCGGQVGGDVLAEAARFPRLERLDFSENSEVTDADLERLYESKALRIVLLQSSRNITAAGARKLSEALPRCQVKMTGATFGPKDKSVPPPASEPDDAPAADADRKAAEVLNASCHLRLRMADGKELAVRRGKPLPDAPFAVVGLDVSTEDVAVFPAGFSARQVVEAVRPLGSLEAFLSNSYRFTLADEDVGRLAAAPFAPKLQALRGEFALSPQTLPHLKRFPRLAEMQCMADPADDDTLAGLKDLPNLRQLGLRFKHQVRVGPQGYAAVAALPLTRLGFGFYGGGNFEGGALQKFAAMPGLVQFTFSGNTGDARLAEIARFPHLAHLDLWENKGVADADLVHLYGMKTLRYVLLKGTSATAAGTGAVGGVAEMHGRDDGGEVRAEGE